MIGKVFQAGLMGKAVVTHRGLVKKGEWFISGAKPEAYEAFQDMPERGLVWVAKWWKPGDPMPVSDATMVLEIKMSNFIAGNCADMTKYEVVNAVSMLLKKMEAL